MAQRSQTSIRQRRDRNRKYMQQSTQRFRSFRHKLKRKYKLTLEDYEKKFQEQNGLCAICLRPETLVMHGTLARLAVDHSHLTGQFRGLLCFKCNTTLGKFGDDILKFQAAIDYLKKYGIS